ncbi:MAG: hypothetical protein GY835_09660 [bacterium]|nr:hypothetical protein [bacterium]
MTSYETGLARMQREIGHDSSAVRRLKFELLGWGLAATEKAWEEVRLSGKYPRQVRSGASCGLNVVLPGGAWVNALAGVRLLADHGVTPILSVFRPLAGTMLANHPKPDPDELDSLYPAAQAACEERGLALGPSSSACQNNTATFALESVLAP